MKTTRCAILPNSLITLVFLMPLVSHGAIVPDCNADCGFNDLITLIKNIVDFLILITAPIAAIMFCYAGFLYVTAGGDTGQIGKAHKVFWTVLVGFLIVLSAWLIVKALSVLLASGFSLLGT